MQECSEARYDEMLGILPPVLMLRKGFLVGEPFDHRLCKVTNVTIPEFKGLRRGEYPMTKKVFRKVRASSFGRPTCSMRPATCPAARNGKMSGLRLATIAVPGHIMLAPTTFENPSQVRRCAPNANRATTSWPVCLIISGGCYTERTPTIFFDWGSTIRI